ncbi:MAG: 5-formyltetrahydrofolate cyclo-ligase [Pseudomonadota bacterium]
MATIDIAAAKAALRTQVYAARKAAHGDDGPMRAAMAAAHLMAEIERLGLADGATMIAGYRPIRTEIVPDPALARLHAAGVPLAMPVVVAKGAPLSFRPWAPGAAEIEGAFGARIPADETAVVPGALIVPLVAFDTRCARLGYGGGFYDRTIAELRGANPGLKTLGLAYDAQRVPAIPRESTDCLLDAVITESAVHRGEGAPGQTPGQTPGQITDRPARA